MGATGRERSYVDGHVHNPRGFLRQPTRPARRGRLQLRDGALVVSANDAGRRMTLGARGVVDGAPGMLRRLQYLDLSEALSRPLAQRRPAQTAQLLCALAARGVPLLTGELPTAARSVLHSDVIDALQSATADVLDEPLLREALSIRQRRAVFRRHVRRQPLTISILAVTRRPQLVDRVAAVAGVQRHADAELVLVTHGFTLAHGDIARVRRLARMPVTVRHADDAVVLGEALNMAAESAGGDVVTKLDDDDHYGPHHLEDLLQSLGWAGATLLGAVDEFTHLSARDLTLRHRRPPRHETKRRRVPGPTMTMRRADLASLGGWAPVAAHVDREMNDAVHRAGGTAHCTHSLGFVRCRHGDRHTWSISDEQLLSSALETWSGLRLPPELDCAPIAQSFASLSSHVPTTSDMNSGCARKPIEA